jgi:hypothetical protein
MTSDMQTNPSLNHILWRQMGASIEMLENAIGACPESLWSDRSREPQVWYLAYHTLFWLDFYLTGKEDEYQPPPPFGLEELDPASILPERVYTREELLHYLDYCRKKAKRMLAALSDGNPGTKVQETRFQRPRYSFRWGKVSWVELQIYNLRHVQHGAAQMNLILRQELNEAPHWVGGAKEELVLP